MAKYCKKPVVIEAVQFNGEMTNELKCFLDKARYTFYNLQTTRGSVLEIDTLEGTMRASEGDYIIRGVRGEYYPCKPDIFKETYYKVDEEVQK